MNWSEKRKLAYEANLDDAELLALPNEYLDQICNGIGAEWMPEKLRKALGKLHPSLIIVADIHDLRWFFGKGTEEDFQDSNRKFESNGIKMAKHLYGWWNPRRYIVMMDARRYAGYLGIGGRIAYYAAISQREKTQEKTGEDLTAMVLKKENTK